MTQLWAWWFAFLRLSPWFGLMPGLGAPTPVRVRILLAAAVSALVSGTMGTVPDPVRMGWAGVVALALQETATGLLLGLAVRAAFGMTAVAGHLVSSEASLNINSLLLPGSGEGSDIVGNLLYMLMTLLMFATDTHLRLLGVVGGSFRHLPVGGLLPQAGLADQFLAWISGAALLGVQVAGPVLVAGLLLNTVLLVLARALPQLNVFAESFAFRSLLVLVVFGSAVQLSAELMDGRLRSLPDDLRGLLVLMGGGRS